MAVMVPMLSPADRKSHARDRSEAGIHLATIEICEG